jgi:hypothetical protein
LEDNEAFVYVFDHWEGFCSHVLHEPADIKKKYSDKDRVNGNNVDVYEIYSISINVDFKSD